MIYKNTTLNTLFRPGTKLIVITSVVCFVLRFFAQDFFDYLESPSTNQVSLGFVETELTSD